MHCLRDYIYFSTYPCDVEQSFNFVINQQRQSTEELILIAKTAAEVIVAQRSLKY